MVALDESTKPRGVVLRAVLLLTLLVGGPWVGRNVFGTVSWRELTERTQERLIELALAAGTLDDPALNGPPDFDQQWGVDYTGGPAQSLARFTFRTEGCGSSRLVVSLADAVHGPEVTIQIDDLVGHQVSLREVAFGLQRLFAELDVSVGAIEERHVVRIFHGEEFEVPAGRSLEIFELGLAATGSASAVAADVAFTVDGVDLLRHGFGGHASESGFRVMLGGDMGYSLPAVRAVLAGERLSVSETSGLQAYVLGVLTPL